MLCLAALSLQTPTGVRPVIYLGDLKIAPTARNGRVLLRLAEAAAQWCKPRANCGFGVVMDGTTVTPQRYTGRLGIPAFRAAANVVVLRLPGLSWSDRIREWKVNADAGNASFANLTADCHTTVGGDPAVRSDMTPVWLVAPDGSACGRLEDTRRAKRLIASDGTEIISAHLSCIGYRDIRSLAALLRVAQIATRESGYPALFAAISAEAASDVLEALDEPGIAVAPATLFASGIECGLKWSINSAEI